MLLFEYSLIILYPAIIYVIFRYILYKFSVLTLKIGIVKKFSTRTILNVVSAFCFVNSIYCQEKGITYLLLLWWGLPFLVFALLEDRSYLNWKIQSVIADLVGIILVISVITCNCVAQQLPRNLFVNEENIEVVIQNSCIMLFSWSLCYLIIDVILVCRGKKKEKIVAECERVSDRMDRWVIVICAGVCITVLILFATMIERLGFKSSESIVTIFYNYVTKPVHILNIYILLLFFSVLYCLLGKGISSVLMGLLIFSLYFATYIKLHFHETFFSWLDLMQIKEMLMISKEYVSIYVIIGIIVVFVSVIFVIIKYRKIIWKVLNPQIDIVSTIAIIGILFFILTFILNNQLKSIDIYPRTNIKTSVKKNGLLISLIYDLRNLDGNVLEFGEGYSKERAESVEKRFDSIGSFSTDAVQPNVILILSESLFDLEGVEGIYLSSEIDSTVDTYSSTTLLSPRYGGYTSAVEFEVLTGLSLAYMPDALIPYTSYFNSPDEEFPCVVREFKNSGYITTAIHPNVPNFYNRDVVFQCFGFDEFHSIDSFEINDLMTTSNGWLKDEYTGNKIIEQLESTNEPQFVFGITVEGHYFDVDKYDETEIKASSDALPEDQLHEVEQQAQSYYDADKMIAQLINYMNNTDRPTLLYVFGDHLPPLAALDTLGYTFDLYQKYSTSFVMYSNYKQLSIEVDTITPNQIAAQMIEDSGIIHSSYYDYIYSLRETYPVLHKEFIDLENNTELEDYLFLQYDILFGKKYLYQKDKAFSQ